MGDDTACMSQDTFLFTVGYRYCGQRDNGSLERLKFAVARGGKDCCLLDFKEFFKKNCGMQLNKRIFFFLGF
jgi:hypothetical protein